MYQSKNIVGFHMKAYLIRLKGDQQFVGIFVCKETELFVMVDECTDPYACEAADIGRGGFFWPTGDAPVVGVDAGDEDDGPYIFRKKKNSLTEVWSCAVAGIEDLTWRSIGPNPFIKLVKGDH